MAKTKPKPREAIVNVHIEHGDSIDGLWDSKKQVLTLRVIRNEKNISARKVVLTQFYMRESGKPKYLNEIELKKPSDFEFSHSNLLKKFDYFWAIDTNQKDIFGSIANVAVITASNTFNVAEFKSTLAIVFGSIEGNPELYAWKKFICFVMNNIENSLSKSFALIVDSELGKLSQFNSQELPIYKDFFLPENWTLIYATADSGKQSIFNKMLIESDKNSTKLMNWMAKLHKNVKHWKPVDNENKYQPTFVDLSEIDI